MSLVLFLAFLNKQKKKFFYISFLPQLKQVSVVEENKGRKNVTARA